MDYQLNSSNLKIRRDIHWAELTEQYLRHLSVGIEAITELTLAQNFNSITEQACQMKNSTCGYQLKEISECFANIENHARNQCLEEVLLGIDDLIKAITAEIQHLDAEIKEQLEEAIFDE